MTSPTVRTLAWARAKGWTVQVVEHWNQFSKIRVDLFGCIDIVGLGANIIGIQCTSGDHHAHRRRKILGLPAAKKWIEAGGILLIVSWIKGKRGEPRVEMITPTHFEQAEQEAKEKENAEKEDEDKF